jgi:tripartite-type tricarboxylate transporter receptor subunit TctC
LRSFGKTRKNSTSATPEQFAAQIRAEVEKWGKVIRSAGIKVD